MHAKDVLRSTMDMGLFVLSTYVSDLSDAELLRRPGPDCNHLAWQLGHLISSEVALVQGVCPGQAAELPPGFAEQHGKENRESEDPAKFLSKQAYLDLYQKVRSATLKALENLPEADLERPSPEWLRKKFPTVGHVLLLVGNHPLLHAGQFAVVRRQLGKPVLI